MTATEKITELRQRIAEALTPLIDRDYVFLEIPYYPNPGDVLIWRVMEDFLETLPYKCLYKSSLKNFDFEVPSEAIILLQGGGNFGDLYYENVDFRNMIISRYPDNKIIILPQTVYYAGYRKLIRDVFIMRKHKCLTVCARDKYSYGFLKRYGFSDNLRLVPDMAFFCDLNYLKSFLLPQEDKTLFVKRVDAELADSCNLTVDCDVSDWTAAMQEDEHQQKLSAAIAGHSLTTQFLTDEFFPHLIEQAVNQISGYGKLYCTRLHAAILSILLDKEVVVMDNSYGKNRHFYQTWLSDVDSVSMRNGKCRLNLNRTIRLIVAYFVLKIK